MTGLEDLGDRESFAVEDERATVVRHPSSQSYEPGPDFVGEIQTQRTP